MNTYEAPQITLLGSFDKLTNAGIGGTYEGWWPIADRN